MGSGLSLAGDGADDGGGVSVDCELNAGSVEDSVRALLAGRGFASVIAVGCKMSQATPRPPCDAPDTNRHALPIV